MKLSLIAAVLGACLALAPMTADAFDYNRGLRGGVPFFGWGYTGLYGLGYVPVPPYYALHPPVHYSHRVSRTYGTSPFASSPREYVRRSEPTIIVNALVPDAGEKKPAAVVTLAPRVIVNPYCEAPKPAEGGEDTSAENVAP